MRIESQKLRSIRAEHGFFGRESGRSLGCFSSLNCSKFVGDEELNVQQNLDIVRCTLNASRLITLKQVHSDICIIADSSTESDIEADGIVTKESDVAIGVLTADCAPILFMDEDSKIVGAAHAGWKGALGGIIESTVRKMIELGSSPQKIRTAIGPCICKESYEVSEDFRQNFDFEYDCFCSLNSQTHFDLPKYCRRRLLISGLLENNVDLLEINTYVNFKDYFSHRWACKTTDGVGGRNISAICMKQ